MLSIGKLGEGGARYYTEGLGAVDEYYSEAGTHTGVWEGVGAELLGLDGAVDPEVLSRVLAGGHPVDGVPLVGSRSARSVPGFDLCFRAPKSVSLLQALGDRDVAAAVLEAHRTAVRDALGYVEREAILVRRGHAGAIVEPGAGVVGACFEHFTSRAGDPHLHSHLLVANMARGSDGRWSALDARALYRHAKTAGYLYEASLRHELTRCLGVEWGPVTNGIADLAGVPRSVIDAFSTRRAQIEAELARAGTRSARAAQVAALATRQAKDTTVTVGELRAEWSRRAGELGWAPETWPALTGPGRPVAAMDSVAVSGRLLGAEGLTEHASSFDRRDLLRAVAEMAGEGATVNQVEALAERVLGDERAIGLAAGPDGSERWTTAELLGVESELVGRAVDRAGGGFGVVPQRLVGTVVNLRGTLSGEQEKMVRSVCTSGDGVQVVIGVAGSGKTFALGAARDAWRAARFTVIGTALSARAAKELSDGAKIPSVTIARLLGDLDDPQRGGLRPGSVLVVDEAAMVGTRDLSRLADHAQRAGAKLVLVGDDRQLPAIGAGGTFTVLAERLGAVELVENRRQIQGWERQALARLRGGDVRVALAAYRHNDRHHHLHSPERLHDRLVSDWANARADGAPVMMLATRRDDVEALNRLARTHLQSVGHLGADVIEMAGRGFAAGDEVICTRNDRQVGVINGTRATVIRVGENNGLVVRDADGTERTIPARYLEAGHLAHAYATTIHKAQGATTERTFILADEYLYKEAGYVALSRGRVGNDIYTTIPTRNSHEGHGPQRAEPGTMSAGLGRSRAQRAATAYVSLPGRNIGEIENQRRELLRAERLDSTRVDQLADLIEQRKQALGVWSVAHPRAEQLEILGEPPRSPDRQAEWSRAAGEIAAYQERHGSVYDPGVVPEHGQERFDHQHVTRVIHDIEPALDLTREHELRHDRDLGLGL